MPAQLVCPECGANLRSASPVAPGKVVRCPRCDAEFRPGGEAVPPPGKSKGDAVTQRRRAEERTTPASPPAARVRRAADPDEPPTRTVRKPAKRGSLWLPLGIVGGVVLLLLAGGLGWWALGARNKTHPQPGPAGPQAGGQREPAPFAGHQGRIMQVAFTGGGRQILSCGTGDGTVRLWDLAGKQLQVMQVPNCWCLAAAPDGRHAVVGASDGALKVLDLEQWREVLALPGHQLKGNKSIVTSAVYSPDGSRILSTGLDYSARLWDAQAGTEVRHYDRYENTIGTPWSAAFFPNGRRFLVGYGQGSSCVYGVDSEKEVLHFSPDAQPSKVGGLAVAPDGVRFVAPGKGGVVRVIETGMYKALVTFRKHTADVKAVALTPDGSRVLSGGEDKVVRLWELDTGAEVQAFTGHTDAITSVAVAPDGKHAVSSGGEIRLWDLPDAPAKAAPP